MSDLNQKELAESDADRLDAVKQQNVFSNALIAACEALVKFHPGVTADELFSIYLDQARKQR